MANAPSQTRDQAYCDSMPGHETQAQKLLRMIREAGAKGITRQQLMDASGFPINIVTARIRPMIDSGIVEKHGQVSGDLGAQRELLIAKEFAGESQAAGDIESRIDAAVEFIRDERTPHEGVKVSFAIGELHKFSRTNKLWPAGTKMQWEDAVQEAIKRGLLVRRDSETVWVPVTPAPTPTIETEAPKQLKLF